MERMEAAGADKKETWERKVILEKPPSSEVLGAYDSCYLYVSPDQAIQERFDRLMNAGSGGLINITLGLDYEGRMQSTGHFGKVLTKYKSSEFGEATLDITYYPAHVGYEQRPLLSARDTSGNEIPVDTLIDKLENSGEPNNPDQQNGASVLRYMKDIVRLGSAKTEQGK